MVKCTIAFTHEDQRWTHVFEVDEGATILDLKQKMLGSKGTKRDVDSFELRLRGQRVSDAEQIFQEHTLDWEYLGPDEGTKRAKEDVEDQKAREKAKQAAETAAKRKAAAKSAATQNAEAKPKSKGKQQSELEFKDIPGKPLWKVVGGADKGGILVRKGLQTSSPQHTDRLSFGAVVEQIELEGERLNYKRITGSGPEEGWVSLTISGKELMKKAEAAEAFTAERAIKLQEEFIEKFQNPAFVQAMQYLNEEYPDKNDKEFQKKRNAAIFGCQREILAAYGFEGSQRGVMHMMMAFGQHPGNKKIDENGFKINKMLGFA